MAAGKAVARPGESVAALGEKTSPAMIYRPFASRKKNEDMI